MLKSASSARRFPAFAAALLAAVTVFAAAGITAAAQSIDTAAIARVCSVYQAPGVLPVPDTVTLDVAAAYRDARVIRRALVRPPVREAAPGATVRPPKPTRLQVIAYVGSIAFSGFTSVWDTRTTDRNVDTGIFVEGNRLVAFEDGRLNKPLKAGISITVPVANHFLLWRRGDRWTAIGVNTANGAAWGAAANRNNRLYREVTADGRVIPH